jgi:hypothetical protein
VSDPILRLTPSQSPVFLLNSRLGLFAAASTSYMEASLLPKLQDEFAEFLSRESPEHLWILSLAACVGLRYGRCNCKRLEAFLGGRLSCDYLLSRGFRVLSWLGEGADLPTPTYLPHFNGPFRRPARTSLPRHPITQLHRRRNINRLCIERPLSGGP